MPPPFPQGPPTRRTIGFATEMPPELSDPCPEHAGREAPHWQSEFRGEHTHQQWVHGGESRRLGCRTNDLPQLQEPHGNGSDKAQKALQVVAMVRADWLPGDSRSSNTYDSLPRASGTHRAE